MTTRSPRRLIAAASLALFAAACEDEVVCMGSFADAGDAGVACAIAEDGSFVEEGCFDPPQICPDISPLNLCGVGVADPDVHQYNVLLLNRGQKPYKILGVQVRGDAGCAIADVRTVPAIGGEVTGGDAAVLNFTFRPTAAGDVQAAIEITTDAENFPTLYLPLCGRGVTGTPSADDCIACTDASQAEVVTCGG